MKNAKMNIFNIYQGGLTLGQREYYLDNDQTTADIRNAYKQFIVDMFKLFGFTEQQAQQKQAQEKQIAERAAREAQARQLAEKQKQQKEKQEKEKEQARMMNQQMDIER